MKKLLIQVVSVITLVFGTSYQSVLALADDRSKTELSGVQLSDAQGNRARQVKVNETNNLEMTVTVNNKDGENADGKADMWLPEDQLKVMQEQVKAESAVTDTNATLIFERRKNKQPQLEWKNVETSATFKLKVPVQFTAPMTSMILPIALGSQREHLQPLAVVSENATEEEMKEAGTPTELPANMVQSLTSFIDAQQAQEAQQAQQAQQEAQDKEDAQQPEQNAESEAPAKDENEDKAKEDKAKEDAAKEEAEAKREAEAKAKQEAEDKKKEDEKTADTLKKNARTANAESEKDGVERESNDKKETRAGTNLNTILQENTGEDRSLFDSIEIKADGQTIKLDPNNPIDVSNLKDFELNYKWDSSTLLSKLNGNRIHKDDYYTFRITGLDKYSGKSSGSLLGTGDEEFARWEVVENNDEYQEFKIIFTNEKANDTQVDYRLSLEQKYSGDKPIDFEQNEEGIWTGKPIEIQSRLTKDGKFVGNQKIEWEITVDAKGLKFSDLKLEDVINTKGAKHNFVTDSLRVNYVGQNDISLLGMFNPPNFDGNKLMLTGKSPAESANPDDDIINDDIIIRLDTSYTNGTSGTFYNQIGGQVSDDIQMENVEAHVTTTELVKTAKEYKDGTYTWEASVKFDIDQFKKDGVLDREAAGKAIQEMVITDKLSGPHKFEGDANLEIKIGSYVATDDFDLKPDVLTDEMVLKPHADSAETLLDKLVENPTLTLTYETKETNQGNVGNLRNQISLEFLGNNQVDNKPGNRPGLIRKDSELSREVHDTDDKAHINWTVTANQGNRKFDELKVTDVLPEGTELDDVSKIKVAGIDYDIGEEKNGVKVVAGWVASTNQVTGTNPYDFTTTKPESGNPRVALQFVIDDRYSEKEEIKITFETVHKWGSDSHTNLVGAATNTRLYEYTHKTQDIDEETRDGGKKEAKLLLNPNASGPQSDNNYVNWKIRFGSHLNHYFGKGDNQTDTIKIIDTLNGDGPRYLSFPTKESDFKLYSLDENRGNPKLISQNEYSLTWPKDSDSRGEREFTITFNDNAKDKKYTNFELEFNTPIDFSAWEKVDNPPSKVPDEHKFENTADVIYANKHLKNLEAGTSVDSEGQYGQKIAKSSEGNFLNWEIIINAMGQDIGKPEIHDTLTSNQRHSVDPKDIELAFVTPKFSTVQNGSAYKVEVDETKPQEILSKEDYSVDFNGNQEMTIQLKKTVDRPLVIRYKTIMENQNGPYLNNARISFKGHYTQYHATHTISGDAFMNTWTLRFLKVDGSDNDKPLAGATFKLQQYNSSSQTWDEAKRMDTGENYGEVVSGPDGLLQFHSLGTITKYRLVEVSPPEGHSSQMAPIEFEKKTAEAAGWIDKAHEIKNYAISRGNLTISKATKNLENLNNFKFEIRAVDKDGHVDTDLQGTYKLQGSGEVTFLNGVSEEITVPANRERTILDLPTEKVDASGNTSEQHYDVREISDRDDYTTQIQVDNDEAISGKQTAPFLLDSNSVTVYVTNTAAKGELVVSKTVSSEVKEELEGKYNFTIKADQKDKVANKEYETEGTGGDKLKFDENGEVTFTLTNSQQMRVKGLPEGVEFTITEDDTDTDMETTWSINGGDYKDSNSSVTIDADKAQIIDFKNSSTKTGQLQITKQIAGNVTPDEEFKFEIETDPKNDGEYSYAKYTVSNQHPGDTGKLNITNGKATLTLKGDQYVRINNLPLRQEFKVSEVISDDSDMETTWQMGEAKGEGSEPATFTLRNENETANVEYTNALPNGSLTLNKKVMNQLPGDQATRFTFNITGLNDDDVNKIKDRTFTVSGDNGMDDISFNDKGQTTLKLTHDQSVKILGLPAGVHLRITEDNHPDFNATYNVGGGEEDDDADGPTVTVPDDKNVSVNYTNTRTKSGSLLLEKQAEGSYPTDKGIGFTIEALDANKDLDDEFSATLRQTDGTTLNKKVEFNGGKANVSIKPGEKLEVKNLPLGEYKVTEDNQEDSVTTTWKVDNNDGTGLVADDATVKENDTTQVLFTNKIANGSLELNKKVLNPLPGDEDTEFTFTIQAADDDIGKVAGETYDVETNFNGRDHVKFNDEGQATLKLSHNQSVKVLGLPAGVQLKISEEQHSDFNVSYTVNGDEDDDEDGPTVTIPDGKNIAVNYTNARPIYGNLMLQKRAEGSYPTDKGIKFTIKALDENQDLERKFDATLTHTNGTTTSQKVSFENGEAEVTILPGEQLLIQNLPTGQYQVTEERQNRLVTTTWDIGTTQGNREKAAPVTVGEGDTAHVRFTNKIATGKLELNKFVASHDDADKDKDYKFELRASRSTRWMVANKSYDVSGHSETKRIEFDRSGRAEISLKDGQTINVSDLPEGVRLAVIETDSNDLKATWNVNSEGSYEELSQRNRPNITIAEDQTEVVSYRNVRDPVGSLRVDKIVKGAYTDDHRKFEFTVDAQKIADKDSNDADTEDADDTDEWITNEEFNGKYNVKVYSRSNNELQENSEVEFTNGQATLELKADQYAVIEGLPLNDDEQFQVSETDPDIANMTTTWAKDNGSPEEGLVAEPVTLDETDVPRITFTNSLETGNLVLDKKLSGEISDTDRNRAFEFTVDAQIEDTETGEWKTDEAFTGDYTATKTTADGRQTTSNVTFENGQLTVALKGGERLQISNLPANMHMVVSETPDGDYETSHQINHGSEMLGTTTDPITIQNGSDQAVTFINDRPAQPQTAWLSLTKSVIGENGERDRGFEFNIRFLDDQMNPLTGTVDVVMTTPLGEHITSQMMLDMDGSSSFALMDGETIRWQVPNGTHYQITESDYSADGYQTSVSQGQAPEREGLTATGVVMTNDPGSAKVVYYNRADPAPEDEPHTPEEPDTTVPGFVPPASEPGTGIGTDTEDTLGGSGTLGTGGSTAPQAHTSGTSGSGTAAKGFLPQTGEWMKQNWLLLLGLVILLSTIGLMVRAKRKKG